MIPAESDGAAALDELRTRLIATETHERQVAVAELIQRPRAELLEPLGERLCDTDRNIRHLAAVALSRLGPIAGGQLAAALAPDQDLDVRKVAASSLGGFARQASNAVGALGACLNDPSRDLRWHAAFALSRIGEPAVDKLLGALGSDDADTQAFVVEALGNIGPAAQAGVSALRQLRDGGPPPLPTLASAALIKITGDSPGDLTALLDAASSQDAHVRRVAIEQIGQLGEQGHGATPMLVETLHDSDGQVVCAAVLAIARLNRESPRLSEELMAVLSSGGSESRRHALMALASFGSASASALESVAALQSDADASVAAMARAAFQMISPGKRPAADG